MLNSKSIGNKIAEARKKINLSQAELAQHVSISAQAVGKWERGESMPDISTLNQLALLFGVDLNYFSENFKTVETAATPIEVADKLADETAPHQQKKRFGWNWDMSKGNWVDADFSGLKNIQEKFSSSNMKNCKFIGSDLSGLILKSNNIENCDFSDSDLRDSKIISSHITKSIFIACSLIDTAFTESEINNCDFTRSNFSGAEFVAIHFKKNVFEMLVLKFTAFKHTHFSDVIFDGTLEDCSFDNCSFSNVTFKNATLTNTFFKSKNLKHIKFIDCQADRMTYEFLKNGNAVLTGITLMA